MVCRWIDAMADEISCLADSLFLYRQGEAKCVIHGSHYSEKREC